MVRPGSDPSFEVRRQPVGLQALDEALGGGLCYARNYLLVGPESTGKTIITQYAAKAIQQSEERNRVAYIDVENSFDRDWWSQSGVDLDKLYIARIITAEEVADFIHAVVTESQDIGLIILDSIAGLMSSQDMEQTAEATGFKTGVPKAMQNVYRTLAALNRNIIFIAINQLRAPLDGSFDEVYPGGRAQRYMTHVTIRTRRESYITDDKTRVGFNMELLFKKNKLGGIHQDGSIVLPFMYGSQIDVIQALIDFAMEKGIVTQAGPYYRVNTGEAKPPQFLGRGAIRSALAENQELYGWLHHAVQGVAQ